jgi:alpha/beta superfamily hydrolase
MMGKTIHPIALIFLLLCGCIGQKAVPHTGQPELLNLSTDDGVTLAATFYPSLDDTAVVLAHMGIADQTSWQDFAAEVARQGISVLTFDFRCYGKSECKIAGGDIYSLKDIMAAYKFLQEKGYPRIACIGASMGGTACLMLAMEKELAGLVVIASERPIFQKQYPKDLVSKSVPKLFIVTDKNPYPIVITETRFLYEESPEPKQLKIFSGDVHGTDIFKTGHGTEFKTLLLDFLEECMNSKTKVTHNL